MDATCRAVGNIPYTPYPLGSHPSEQQVVELAEEAAPHFKEQHHDSDHERCRRDEEDRIVNPTLREHLTRERRNRDPYRYYEVVEVLGAGSMGTVSKVKKKPRCVGGSARPRNVTTSAPRSLRNINPLGKIVRKISGRQRGATSGVLSDYDGCSVITSSKSSDSRDGSVISSTASSYEVYYALKSIRLDRVKGTNYVEELRNEVEILKKLDHPYIVKAIEVFERKRQMYMVLELCSGGDLYTRDPYSEDEAARIVGMIISAVKHMHEMNIIHRDLKFENIMFASDSPVSEVKIIDFGLSKKYGPDEPRRLKKGVGSIYTMAPEVLCGEYDEKADLWSVGVITYMLLSSGMPFYGAKRSEVTKRIMNGHYTFNGRRWKNVSQQAKMFVTDLLQMDQDERPTAAEARQSLWINKSFAVTVNAPEIEVCLETLHKYTHYSMLQKLALMVVAHKSTSEEVGFLRKVFLRFSKGHTEKTGVITKSQFTAAMDSYGYLEEDIDDMFRKLDIDGSGFIQYTEFIAATMEAQGPINEERLAEAFDRLDSDDTGYISANNLRSFLGGGLSQATIEKMIAEVDLDEDRKISYHEFLTLWDSDNEQRGDAYVTKSRISSESLKEIGQLDPKEARVIDDVLDNKPMHDVWDAVDEWDAANAWEQAGGMM